ncbi:precorrin-3B synthase [Streptomyces mashuensis]|uniref:Precorrin-3B synthase n=1 Tax=Streptomyces mashuensis TaxID=33904 RepID=A0A919AY38_9ACTN|nr:nitrite/sulfite reductase [Streptomyces mashuensis]GHF29069.1 precorrin-3B synthase [Streptomyces mashuensis]
MPGTPDVPPDRPRGDACPGALRLHAADDGALARVRLPGGLLTARQAEALAGLADTLGDGHLDLTSRGNVQLRGLPDDCGAGLGERLRAAGLLPSDRHDRVRNVVASPVPGLVHPWVRELDRLLCSGEPDLSALSGRFLFGLDDGCGDIVALAPDVTLIAEPGGHHARLGFGTDGPALRVPGPAAPRAAVLAAAVFLDVLRDTGRRAWRVRELPPEHRPGIDALARRLSAAGITSTPLPHAGATAGPPPAPGVLPAPGGRCALSVHAPLGRLTSAQWRLLARTAGRDGDGELRVTPWRGVVLPGLPAATAPARLTELGAAGLVTSTASPWYGAGACAGRPGCAKSLADVRADAAACLTASPPGGPGALPVYWSGCERRCGHPGGRWVDVLATDAGYRVTSPDGGRTVPAAAPAADLATAVARARTTTRTHQRTRTRTA